MRDLPTNGLLQQLNARTISGEHLEVLGKKAAADWMGGCASTLNDAVVETVKHAGLSPEQVKRVVEFANTEAYLAEHRKEGSVHRFVDFGAPGPANPAVVLQDLNDGGGGSVFDPGDNSFFNPPREKTKESSARSEAAFEAMFQSTGVEYPEVNPLSEVLSLRDKLASVYEGATSELSGLENMYGDLQRSLFCTVKQAALEGHELSEVAEIWTRYAPTEEHVKVAFNAIFSELVANGVFANAEALVDSLTKHASVGVVNEEHPLVADFKDFCDVLSKLADVRDTQREAQQGLTQLNAFVKRANDGLLPQIGRSWSNFSDTVGQGASTVGEVLAGAPGKKIGPVARFATKYVVPAVAANEVYRRTIKHNPLAAKLRTVVPGTNEYYNKELELEMGNHGGYPMG